MGTNLIDFYRSHRAQDLVNWDISTPRNAEHKDLWFPLDLTDGRTLSEALARYRPDVIFHLGARTDLSGKSVADYSANVDGVANLIQAVQQISPIPRVIFASSRLVCRIGYEPRTENDYCPPNPYGESKVCGEQIIRETAGNEFDWLIVRPTSIWGPWFRTPYRDFFDAVAQGRYLHPSGKKIYKSFGFVGNTCVQLDQLMFAGFGQTNHQTIYLADYPPLEVHEWSNEISRYLGRSEVKTVPVSILRLLARSGDLSTWLGISPPLTTFRLNNLLTHMVHDTALLQQLVGELPFSLSEATRLTVDWLEKSVRQTPDAF